MPEVLDPNPAEQTNKPDKPNFFAGLRHLLKMGTTGPDNHSELPQAIVDKRVTERAAYDARQGSRQEQLTNITDEFDKVGEVKVAAPSIEVARAQVEAAAAAKPAGESLGNEQNLTSVK